MKIPSPITVPTSPITDSHCHLTYPGLIDRLDEVLTNMRSHHVHRALCASVNLDDHKKIMKLIQNHDHIYGSVGVHPDDDTVPNPTFEELLGYAHHPRVIAIGETGLDYYRLNGRSIADMKWQRDRFITHIAVANTVNKPLIIHTRSASEDTIEIMSRENASQACGVMHCFTESITVAQQALDLGFYISFSGIITFKNADSLREVVAYTPIDRILVETDSPYLAPTPYRGKTNEPAYTSYVVEQIARIKNLPYEQIAQHTENNFQRLFKLDLPDMIN